MKPGPRPTAAATLPPRGLPGLDPTWSRLVQARSADGSLRTWHCLDTRAAGDTTEPVGTLVCVHGNPTWSYLWRRLLSAAPVGWRVVAPDHLGMGYSERVSYAQTLADRVADLGEVLAALGVTGPVVTVAHDWGGAISLGWALAHRDQLAGIVLLNTAVSQPPAAGVPALIAVARTPGVLRAACVQTPTFLRGTLRLAHPALPAPVRSAYLAPYAGAGRREAVGDFVADIPLTDDHPTKATLDAIADGLSRLGEVPVLLLWGPRDPVFADRYLRDLQDRLPQAQVHRFEGAGHLVAEDRDIAAAVAAWLPAATGGDAGGDTASRGPAGADESGHDGGPHGPPHGDRRHPRALWAALDERTLDPTAAIVELSAPRSTGGAGGPGGAASTDSTDSTDRATSVSFAELDQLTRDLAAGLTAIGVVPGDRVALLVPPGVELASLVYACWRIGAVVVLADAGLGRRGMSAALRGAGPKYVVGVPRALAAARALRWPGTAIAAGSLGVVDGAGAAATVVLRTLGARLSVDDLRARGAASTAAQGSAGPGPPGPRDEAAVLFTSGATGPAKGVVYRHGQLQAQRDLLVSAYEITAGDRLVAAFAPFALYGPALGITSAVPDMDVTAPATLTAAALADAVEAVGATLVFSSPAALVNVAATAGQLSSRQRRALAGVRLLLSAGAPVPASLLHSVAAVLPNAEAHTPYGMTEVLPVTDITAAGIDAAGPGNGVCVGRPLPGVQVAVRPLDSLGRPEPTPTDAPGVTGEICVGAEHVKDRYDRLWLTDTAAVTAPTTHPGWHRSGDVGHFDQQGRLWVEGRLVHVVSTADGVVTPVGVEQRVQALPQVAMAAVAGVGPPGAQVVVVVVTLADPAPGARPRRPGPLADTTLAAAVRAAAGREVAAVLVAPALPVDIRHNSKIDRTRVAAWADAVLRGDRVRGGP